MKQRGVAGGGASRRLASAFNGPRKCDLPSQIGRFVAEALDRHSLSTRPSLRHNQASKTAPSCRCASMAATLRVAGRNVDSMRAYLIEHEEQRRESLTACSAPSAIHGDRKAPICVICLEERAEERGERTRDVEESSDSIAMLLEALPCGHIFHRACISQWLQYRRCCPIDRLSVNAEEDTDSGS